MQHLIKFCIFSPNAIANFCCKNTYIDVINICRFAILCQLVQLQIKTLFFIPIMS